jgi:hypothetical protein
LAEATDAATQHEPGSGAATEAETSQRDENEGRRRRRRQEVTILALPLADPHAPLLLSWSLLSGAALVLEPDHRALGATAVWARPTLFLGDDEDLRRLASEAGDRAPSPVAALVELLRRLLALLGARLSPPLPLGRLHTVLRIGESRDGGAEGPWAGRVRVLDASAFVS